MIARKMLIAVLMLAAGLAVPAWAGDRDRDDRGDRGRQDRVDRGGRDRSDRGDDARRSDDRRTGRGDRAGETRRAGHDVRGERSRRSVVVPSRPHTRRPVVVVDSRYRPVPTRYRHVPTRYRHVHRRWVAGHYAVRTTSVWVPGYYREEHVPAVHREKIGLCGVRIIIVVRPAYTRQVWVPGHYETRTERYWVPGYWETCH